MKSLINIKMMGHGFYY